jgi:hypothetical protein
VPAQELSALAFKMFKDIWDERVEKSAVMEQSLKTEAAQMQKQIDKLLDRLVDATNDSVSNAYEQRIEKMQ